jgi:hypothetical protein
MLIELIEQECGLDGKEQVKNHLLIEDARIGASDVDSANARIEFSIERKYSFGRGKNVVGTVFVGGKCLPSQVDDARAAMKHVAWDILGDVMQRLGVPS